MFNIFPKYGSPGDSISPEELVGKNNNIYPTWTWTTGIKDADGKEISVTELISKYNTFLKENKDLNDLLKSIEEDGTEEHNNAIKLREENVNLKNECALLRSKNNTLQEFIDTKIKVDWKSAKIDTLEDEIHEYKKGNKNWMNLYQEVVDKNNELLKEVNGLRLLKKENVELFERVNEVDSVVNERYRAEIFTLKNDIAVLKNRNTELLEKYNGFVTMGGQKYMEAKLQIVQNNYKKCAEERDEFKHQLNAANKEIEALKSRVRDWEDKYAKSFSYDDMYKLEKEVVALKKEKAILERWKYEQLIVNKMWDKVDSYVRDHDDAPLGGFTANTCLNFLKQRDQYKAEVEKLKQDIVDYVIVKDDRIEQLQKELKQINEVKKTQDWNALNASQVKQKEIHGIEETKPFKPWIEVPIDWKGDEGIISLEDRVKKLEKKVEELTLIRVNGDSNYKYFTEHGKWPWNNEHTK